MNRAWMTTMTAAVVIALVLATTPAFAGGLRISIGGIVVGLFAPAPVYQAPPQQVVVYQPPPQVVYQQPVYQPAYQPQVVYQGAYQPAYQPVYQPVYAPPCPQQVTWRGHYTYTPIYSRGVCVSYRQMWVHD